MKAQSRRRSVRACAPSAANTAPLAASKFAPGHRAGAPGMTAKSGWTGRGRPSALTAGEAVRGSTEKPPMRPKGARCCLELEPLRGYRRGEGRGCQGRECKRLIAPRGEVEVVWSCSCRNRAVVALDGQDKDAPVHRTASHCSARPITPGRIVVTRYGFSWSGSANVQTHTTPTSWKALARDSML